MTDEMFEILYQKVKTYIVKKGKRIEGYEQDDIVQECLTYLLPKLIDKEVEDNYIFKAIENHIKNINKKIKREIKTVSLDNTIAEDLTYHDIICEKDYDHFFIDLDDEILSRVSMGFKINEIASQLGIHRDTVYRKIKKYKEENK